LARDVQAQNAARWSTDVMKVKQKIRADGPKMIKDEHE